jgi:CheY-like chemotaxis protein
VGRPNKRMQLTKLRAAPVRQAQVPPCAPAGHTDGGTASQLIPGVLGGHYRGKGAHMIKRRLCFIDDEQDELSRAARTLFQDFDIGTGSDLDSAVGGMRGRPHLFLLDMYYGPKTTTADRLRVGRAWQELLGSQRGFYDLLRSLGQSADGGLELAAHVRRRYPGVPIAFFTRKGSLEDAVRALREGAAAVLKKPDATPAADDARAVTSALDAAMTAYRGELVRRLTHIIDQHSWWARHPRLVGFIEGVAASVAAGVLLHYLLR